MVFDDDGEFGSWVQGRSLQVPLEALGGKIEVGELNTELNKDGMGASDSTQVICHVQLQQTGGVTWENESDAVENHSI